MKRKLFFKFPILLFAFGISLLVATTITGYAKWTNAISNNSWSTTRYLYNVVFIYTDNSEISYTGLERNSKIDLIPFRETGSLCTWRVSGSNTNYSGVLSINDLYNADTTKTSVVSNGVTTITMKLYQTYLGIADGYFKVEVNSGVNMSSNNASLTLDYSYVTKLNDNFYLFNVNPKSGNLTLDHFVIGETSYALNDVLHLESSDASLLSNQTLTLIAYFK